MNAGCYGGETWTCVARVEVLLRTGTFVVRMPDDYAIGYRSVKRADGAALDGIFTAAWFRFPAGDADDAPARIRALLARRIISQPLDMPNAGGVSAIRRGSRRALIEACGLKGHHIGAECPKSTRTSSSIRAALG
jgi:UDP-N-acetylmuramate dehydrogenase